MTTTVTIRVPYIHGDKKVQVLQRGPTGDEVVVRDGLVPGAEHVDHVWDGYELLMREVKMEG